MKYIRRAERGQRIKAPKIPSRVFFGEMPWAKGVFPKSFPKRSPPLSACHERQKTTEINLGLIMSV